MIKRVVDCLISLLLLAITFPIIFLVSVIVFLKLGSPVFFIQDRPGLNGRVFKLVKFRTMSNKKNADGVLLPDRLRITSFGNWLRSTSIDELPSLFNVLKGDMSLVGPRPLLVEYLPLYDNEQAKRHNMRPGITGWAQVNGRNAISWRDKFSLDVWYVNNQSFFLDIKILLLTAKKVIIKEGITAEGHVTMDPFTGNENQNEEIKSE